MKKFELRNQENVSIGNKSKSTIKFGSKPPPTNPPPPPPSSVDRDKIWNEDSLSKSSDDQDVIDAFNTTTNQFGISTISETSNRTGSDLKEIELSMHYGMIVNNFRS